MVLVKSGVLSLSPFPMTLCDPWTVARQAPLSMGILQARTLEWVTMPSSRRPSQTGIKPRSPTLQADSLLSEPPAKCKWLFSINQLGQLGLLEVKC